MSTKVLAIVKPELLVWARESARLSIVDAAKKSQISPEKLANCEAGQDKLTINQLRTLAKVYKRPLAVFFLAKPPKHFDALRDFRRLPESQEVKESPQLGFEIRRAIYRRKAAIEMYQELGESIPKLSFKATLEDDPEVLAGKVREFLGVTTQEQYKFKGDYDALRHWRNAIERKGILIFQAPKISLDEMRGFSISEVILPIIVVNAKDSPYARIFSILHEFAHLLLRQGGLCDLKEPVASFAGARIEVFCNHLAGAVLVPKNALLAEPLVVKNKHLAIWPTEPLGNLSKRFQVSREVILRRLLIAGLITESSYQKTRKELRVEFEKYTAAISEKEKSGFTTPDVKAISEAGQAFVQLVLNSYYQEKITLSDVSDFLEVRLRHLPKIERAVQQRIFESGAIV
ncbi:MAG TPA: XRE family transcriptional regulator [Blastocatellia bacterium]|nr:XRE family transcriptional regulator [Blastocatellia bacterium]